MYMDSVKSHSFPAASILPSLFLFGVQSGASFMVVGILESLLFEIMIMPSSTKRS